MAKARLQWFFETFWKTVGPQLDTSRGNFVTLFSKDFPHIVEKIFFSLDYESYKNCMKVNSEWADLLTSERYETKAKVVFRVKIWEYERELRVMEYERQRHRAERQLQRAARMNDIDQARIILESGMVDVDCGWVYGYTPLFEAVTKGHKEMARFLVSKGANSSQSGISGTGEVWLREMVLRDIPI